MTTAVPVAWLIARASGLVAFGLLTLSVWLGLAMSTRLLGPKRQKPLLALHRTLAWTGLSMVALHIGGLLLDPVLHFGVLAVLVPGAAAWRTMTGTMRASRTSGWRSDTPYSLARICTASAGLLPHCSPPVPFSA